MNCGVEFSDISLGQVEEARAPTKTRQTDLPNESKNLLLDERARLLQYVSDGYALDAVAAMCKVRLPVVHDAISEMSRAIAWAALAEHTQISNTRIQCRLVSAFSLWSRAALQKKHLGIRQMLASDLAAGKWRELEWLWNAWLQCNEHGDLSLVNSQAAITFVKAVLQAGVPRRALLIVSQVGSVPLAPDISRLGLDVRTVKKREGRAAHRLQMSDPATAASSTSGAALSVLGLHWWMLCLGSVLLSRDGV
jgi:hypothetical protein